MMFFSLQGGDKWRVALIGGLSSLPPLQTAMLWSKAEGRQLDHLVLPPGDKTGIGFQTIAHQSKELVVRAEGMVILRGRTVAVSSGDCPIVVAYNEADDRLAATHAGRPALTPGHDEASGFTVIAPLLSAVAPRGTDRSQVQVHITAAICGRCFRHDHPDMATKIAPFRKHYPDAIVGDHGLDLIEVIRQECIGRGISPENIKHDGFCTKEHPFLASHQNGDKERNLTVVTHY